MSERVSMATALSSGFRAMAAHPFQYLGVIGLGAVAAMMPIEALETLEAKPWLLAFWTILLLAVMAVTWTSLAALTISIDEEDPLDIVDALLTGAAHTLSVVVGLVVASLPFIVGVVVWFAALDSVAGPEMSSGALVILMLTFFAMIFCWILVLYLVPAAVLEEECGGVDGARHAWRTVRERWIGLFGLLLLLALINLPLQNIADDIGNTASALYSGFAVSLGVASFTTGYRLHRRPGGAPAASSSAPAPPPLPPHLR